MADDRWTGQDTRRHTSRVETIKVAALRNLSVPAVNNLGRFDRWATVEVTDPWEGCSSLFVWCMDVLHLSADAAYGRLEVARVARRYPIVLEGLVSGSVTMTAIALLRPYLTDANHRHFLADAQHQSKRDIERLVAALAPKPDVPPSIRELPAPAHTSDVPAPTLIDPVRADAAPPLHSCLPPLADARPEMPTPPVSTPPPVLREFRSTMAHPEGRRLACQVRVKRSKEELRCGHCVESDWRRWFSV